MKTIATSLLFLLLALTGWTQEPSYLLADKVNVRSGPETSASIVANLPIGYPVTELEEAGRLNLKGLDLPWIKIRFAYDGRKMMGYVWKGFISRSRQALDRETYLVWGPEKIVAQEYWNDLHWQFRVYRGTQELDRVSVSKVGDLGIYREVFVTDGRSVPGVQNIIRQNYSAEYCGGAMGDVILFWDGQELHHAHNLVSGADAPYWFEETFVYPADSAELGQEILLIGRSGGDDVPEEVRTVRYQWTGQELVAVEEKEAASK